MPNSLLPLSYFIFFLKREIIGWQGRRGGYRIITDAFLAFVSALLFFIEA